MNQSETWKTLYRVGAIAAGRHADDRGILECVRSVLNWNPDIGEQPIDASCDSGVVTLTGEVDAYWKKRIAAETAESVSGVRTVRDEVSVVPTGDYHDRLIAEEIQETFRRRGEIPPGSVDVGVSRGIVTLSGLVPSWAAYSAAYETASLTRGVREVVNNLQVH